ncbi:MAG TPA: hypothetical protein VFY26_19360 [Anaerolineales bacterium]|nr:hypothetical protein [Anaerolineales bacterium]
MMNRLNTSSSTLIYSAAADFGPGPVHRLLVLIPPASDYAAATAQISDLATTYGAQVLFLGLCQDASNALSLRRELVTLSALLQDARVHAETKVEIGNHWVGVVKSNLQAGDLIVCFAEQLVGRSHRPLSEMLVTNAGVPVYILSTPYSHGPAPSNWFSKIATWTGFAGIITGAFLVQTQILSVSKDWAQTTLLVISVFAELWLIWIWNSLFG